MAEEKGKRPYFSPEFRWKRSAGPRSGRRTAFLSEDAMKRLERENTRLRQEVAFAEGAAAYFARESR